MQKQQGLNGVSAKHFLNPDHVLHSIVNKSYKKLYIAYDKQELTKLIVVSIINTHLGGAGSISTHPNYQTIIHEFL